MGRHNPKMVRLTTTDDSLPPSRILLKFPKPMWVFIGLTTLLWFYVHHGGRNHSKTLDFLSLSDVTVIRSTAQSHRFDRLGVQINTPENWAYLSTSDNTVAESLLYANSSDQIIVRLRPASRALTRLTHNESTETSRKVNPSLRWLEFTRRDDTKDTPAAAEEPIELFSQFAPSPSSWLNVGLCEVDGTTWIVQMSDLKRRDQNPACLSKLLSSIKRID